jgi:hypothetical protein
VDIKVQEHVRVPNTLERKCVKSSEQCIWISDYKYVPLPLPVSSSNPTGEPPLTLGFNAENPAHVSLDDTAYWTFIHKTPFEFHGEVNEFSLGVGVIGRALRVGIYRPTGPGSCSFQLVQQREWSGFANGHPVNRIFIYFIVKYLLVALVIDCLIFYYLSFYSFI